MTMPGTDVSSFDKWWKDPSIQRRWQLWTEKTTRLSTVEFGLSSLILLIWAVFGTWGTPVLTLFAIVLGISLHVAAAENGNQVLLWMATGFVLGCMLLAAAVQFVEPRPVSLAVGSFTAVVYNELLRLHHARRRLAKIEEEVYVGSAIGMGLLALFSLIGISLADQVDGDGTRSWLWMAVTVILLISAAATLITIPHRRFPKGSSQRWQPGDRIPPQPLGQFEADG